jgi:hypothetical protein
MNSINNISDRSTQTRTRTNDISLSLSGFPEADLVLIESPPLPMVTLPQDGIILGSAFSIAPFEMRWIRTREKKVAIHFRRVLSGVKVRLCGVLKFARGSTLIDPD